MACIPIPQLPVPTLPLPLTIAPPAVPQLTFDPELCCKLLPFPLVTPPVPLPSITINPVTIAIVTNTMAQIQAFLNSLQITCPKE